MPTTNGRNAKLIKIHNRALVLKIIRQNGSISRKDIAAFTGLTQATITKITRDLLDQGLIVEQDHEQTSASSGRKLIGLAINREKYKMISVHIGRHAQSECHPIPLAKRHSLVWWGSTGLAGLFQVLPAEGANEP